MFRKSDHEAFPLQLPAAGLVYGLLADAHGVIEAVEGIAHGLSVLAEPLDASLPNFF